ncbi:SWI/SNF-related matrix-associated actin-dependent regulator of chromatin subfamily E member 1-like isoform X2 [Amblyomma americanum]
MALPPNDRQARMAASTPPAPQNLRPPKEATSNSSTPEPPPANTSSFMPPTRKRRSRGIESAISHLPKPPKAPHRPLTPYMKYSRLVWNMVRTSGPDLKMTDVGRTTGQMWRELPDETKQQYLKDYETEMIKYKGAYELYLNSPAYQAWLEAKSKVQATSEAVSVAPLMRKKL